MSSALARPSRASEVERLRNAVARLEAELAEIRAQAAALEAVCHEDALTGVLNRRGFERDLARAIAFARRYGTPVALLLIDLDRFKPINDTYGHAAGDAALKHVATLLKSHLRASDSVGRLGGDEFGIVLWQVDEALARRKADSLEQLMLATGFTHEGVAFVVGGSVGSAPVRADDDPAAALARADAAMYARKLERRAAR